MKQRFSSLDIKVIAHELSVKLLSLRVSSIYDLSTVRAVSRYERESKDDLLIRCRSASFCSSLLSRTIVSN